MATLTFPARYDDKPEVLRDAPEIAGLAFKHQTEVVDSIAVLNIWRDEFSKIKGDLIALEHRSQGDDPPDVVAHFEGGRKLCIEHTVTEHSHLIHHRDIFRGGGCTIPARSRPTKSRKELIAGTFSVLEPGPWVRAGAEEEADRLMVYTTIEKKLEPSKLARFPEGGLLVMAIESSCRSNFRRSIERALIDIRRNPAWKTFTYCAIDRPTPGRFVSLLSRGREYCQWREGNF
jgi:hypothetical protein